MNTLRDYCTIPEIIAELRLHVDADTAHAARFGLFLVASWWVDRLALTERERAAGCWEAWQVAVEGR